MNFEVDGEGDRALVRCGGEPSSPEEKKASSTTPFQTHLTSGLKHFLVEGDFLSDVTLVAEGQSVRSHKTLLSLCSPHFKQLFQENSAKNTDTIVILNNVRFQDLQRVMKFLYNGEIKVSNNNDLQGLLETGELLQIEGLENSNSSFNGDSSLYITEGDESSREVTLQQNLTFSGSIIEENIQEESLIRILPNPEPTLIFIREILTSRIEIYQVREKMIEGLQFSNQFGLGALTGCATAFLIKNFGKAALISLGGGLAILTIASKKGFIQVNWSSVLRELQERDEQINSNQNNNDSNLSINDQDWTVDRIQDTKKWISEHSAVVTGFVGAFFYNIL